MKLTNLSENWKKKISEYPIELYCILTKILEEFQCFHFIVSKFEMQESWRSQTQLKELLKIEFLVMVYTVRCMFIVQ